MKKIMLIGLVLSLLIISGCAESSKVTTFEELKEKKATGSTEHQKCLKEAEENEKAKGECIRNKLKEEGYTDDVNCIMDSQNPVCNLDAWDCINKKMSELGYKDYSYLSDKCDLDFGEDPDCTTERREASNKASDECYALEKEKRERYNAEVRASNECMEEFKDKLTQFDCIGLIGK